MTDFKTRLQQALGDGYTLERELGGGGMSRVFVATDTELGRKVVVKVLPPEMGAGVNAERFRREIQLAASLNHPHIVQLLHAGRQNDLLYYTMPLVEGESLRAKLGREGELPIAEAVRILRDVVDALAYAHAHGVVHRDIKPDNVLITGRHAVVTDFGVAKALSESTGEQSLTSIGVALGTPAYMAPEQAAAETHVDHRADLYAFGVMAYEILTGRPPFTGHNAQSVLAAHVMQAPDPLAKHRASVPPALAALIMRCLEKKPADRWQNASAVHAQLEGMATPSGGMEPTTARPATRMRPPIPRVALLASAAAAVMAVVAFLLLRGGSGPAIDTEVVAVLPFRVAGADPALHYLREGMIDLLAAKLTGEGGPRAADPRTVTSAFRRAAGSETADLSQAQAVDVAEGIGAGRALLGAIVGSPAHLTLSASVVAVPGGATRAQATVEGPADSLPALVDRLTSQLLIRDTRLVGGSEASLTTRSLPALQAYLAGQKAYRRADYDEAGTHFSRALGLDSSFTLAGVAMVFANGWGFQIPRRVRELAWSGRDRLSQRDRAMLEAYLGPRYPEPPLQSDLLSVRERLVDQYPDVADAWYLLADKYFHEGRFLGYADWQQRAVTGFERAVALDSSFVGPLSHLVNLGAWLGDTAAVRRYGRLYDASAARGARFDFLVRWDLARALGEPQRMREFWVSYDTSPNRPVYQVIYALSKGGSLGTLDSLLAIIARRAGTDAERRDYHDLRGIVSLNAGRPRAAAAQADSSVGSENNGFNVVNAVRTLSALYLDADTVVGNRAAERLAAAAALPLPDSGRPRGDRLRDACILELWRLAHHETASVPRTVALLKSAVQHGTRVEDVREMAVCTAILEGLAALDARRPDALRFATRADSLMRLGPLNTMPVPFQNLVIGRLLAAAGQPDRGLAAVRRGGQFEVDLMVTTYLREQGRLAALTGDRKGAIRAYNRYLELRADPEPAVKPVVDEVRAELARLAGEQPQRP